MDSGNLTKERLLDEATTLFHQKGFGATSVSDLLAAAGIKKGTLYYHFSGGKDDLALAVLQRAKTRFLAELDDVLAAPSPTEGLHRFFEYALDKHRRKGFVGGCLFGNTALEMSDVNSRYADAVADVFRKWTAKIEAVVQAGQKSGEFRADIPADRLAQMIVSTVEGGIMMSRLQKQEGPLKACLESITTVLKTTIS